MKDYQVQELTQRVLSDSKIKYFNTVRVRTQLTNPALADILTTLVKTQPKDHL